LRSGERERVERRLAAILAVTVVDYSRLIGADKDSALERLKAHVCDWIDPKIRQYGGHLVQPPDDGSLVEFPSVVDAVRCAAEIQRGMLDREQNISAEQRICFRMGIDLGDIVVHGDTIDGDSITTAVQLGALAEPGGICMSRMVRDQVCDELPYAFTDLGEQRVRNFDQPARGWSPGADAANAPLAELLAKVAAVRSTAGAHRLSIVVLPFANLSTDPGEEYFADGVTEDLTGDLSRLRDMFVISKTTALTYRDKPTNFEEIGRELNVRYVLTGGICRMGNRVRANVELVHAETGTGIWTDRFEYEAQDVFTLQDEVTGRIVTALDLEMTAAEAERPTTDPDALDYLLRGRAVRNRGATRENLAEAIDLFATASVIDPGCGQAKALLAETLIGGVLNQLSDSTAADLERAQALIIDAQFSSARASLVHFVKGQNLRAQCRFEAAILEYETAVALDRNAVKAFAALGQCRFLTGAVDEAIPAQMRALRLSPRDPNVANWFWRIGMVRLLRTRIDEAILWLERAQSANSQLPGPWAWLAAAYALKADTERAGIALTEARRLSGDLRYSSIAEFIRSQGWALKTYALAQTTFFAGLRRAGVPEK
jgi:adenylate cyclase